jgi:hypothetical protein
MKTLVHNYTFDPSLNKVVIKGIEDIKRFLLITNVTKNEIIYSFNNPSLGVEDFVLDHNAETTTLTLTYNCSQMDEDDVLQIFFESDEVLFEPSETFVDPVSKIRVSTPENLIDTDFEYGLQSSKWETLELSNNVPSFYVSDSDSPLSNIANIEALAGSTSITVNTKEPHGIVQGTPIDVNGLSSRTAEGKFLVKSVPTTSSFTYEANGPQTFSGFINNLYTTITPGQFYTGSQIPFKQDSGLVTDGATPSNITVTTPEAHGFKQNSNFYLVNSIGTKKITLNSVLSSNAPDGRPFVDTTNTISSNFNINGPLTETKQMKSTYSLKFNASAVDISNSTITWNNHRFRENDCLLYVPPANDTQIGNMQRFQVYYVNVFDSNRIRFRTSFNGSIVSFSSPGTYNFGRASLNMVYEIQYTQKDSNSYYTRQYTTRSWTGSGSGWDLQEINSVGGLSGRRAPYRVLFSRNGFTVSSWHTFYYFSSGRNGNMQMPESGSTPGLFNFIEDYTRYISYEGYSNANTSHEGSQFRTYDTNTSFGSGGAWQPGYNSYYIAFLEIDEEADTFFAQNHGLSTGDALTLSGGNVFISNSDSSEFNTNANLTYGAGSYTAQRVSNDRFRISFPGNRTRIASTGSSYSITSLRNNPTKNSFYFEKHGYSSGTNVNFLVETGGSVPQTNIGRAVPDSRRAEGNIKAAWGIMKTSMDSYVTTLSGHQNVFLNGSANSFQPISSGVTTGPSLLSSFNLAQNPFLQSIYRSGGQSFTPSNDLFFNRQSSTIVKDAAEGTSFADQGWSFIGTDFVLNTTVPHYSLLWSYSHPTNQDVTDFRVYSRTTATQMTTHSQTNRSYTIGADSSWKASYGARYSTSGSAAGYVEFNIIIWNEANWTPFNDDTLYQITVNGNGGTVFSQPYSYNSSFWSRAVQFRTFFMLASGASYNNAAVDALATKLVTDLANNFTFPQLNTNTEVIVKPINDNRFAIENFSGFEYDLTTSGTPGLSFEQSGVVGVSDGAYRVQSIPEENKFVLELPFASPATKVNFLGSAISNNIITTQFGHYFLPGTAVVYNSNGNTPISGLIDEETYYIYVQNESQIGLAGTFADAIDGKLVNVSAGTSDIHHLSFSLINGRLAGVGTISTVNGNKKVTGNAEALFKRFFKVGDRVGIKNTTVTPATIESFRIAAIADDTNMELTDIVPFTATGSKYFLETKLYARPDGYAVHRSFDGGVEIAAGTAPYSQIMRQTRKYFRYQSGKGIQTSLAINFNPPIQFETLQSLDITGLKSDLLDDEEKSFTVNIANNIISGDQFVINNQVNPTLTLIRGVRYTLAVNIPGNRFFIQTVPGAYDSNNEFVGGLSSSGASSSIVTFDVPLSAPTTLYYTAEINGITANGIFNIIENEEFDYKIARGTTRYPHRLHDNTNISVSGSTDDAYNGNITVFNVVNDYTFDYILETPPSSNIPGGIIQFNLRGYTDAFIRAGMFDFQNGFFFEFDGTDLHCVRRSSTQQLSGSVAINNESNRVIGSNTNFIGQLQNEDFIVVRGQSYKVVKIVSPTELIIQPEYKGISATNVILTKTVDTKVRQSEWNLDTADGTGPSGFKLNIDKIQMAYMDYSWYGAGKVRFGFKDNKGHVKYVHEFVHNNRMDEAYMRSGNLPGRYEIVNGANPSYAPTLFHWGTSVIMDGRFDNDKAYLFTAQSKTLSFTNGQGITAVTNGSSTVQGFSAGFQTADWYNRLSFASADASKFSSGTKLYNNTTFLGEVAFTQFSGGTVFVYIFLQRSRFAPSGVPVVGSGVTISIGLPAGALTGAVNLGTDTIPLITIRLAPSVDTGIAGALGAREIINRMQLQLNEVGLILTNDCEVKLILNGDLSSVNWEGVGSPSLSQLLRHDSGDKVVGGSEIFSFRASGGGIEGGVRLSATSNFNLSEIIDLGNSMLGGDGTYPNGPDILTIAVKVIDTQGINATSPFRSSSRITWSESQA